MQDEVEVKARELLANAPVTRFIGHDFVPKVAAIRAIAAVLRQRPVVDDAMVERACRAYEVAMDGEVFRPEVPEIAMRAALLAAYQHDNGGK